MQIKSADRFAESAQLADQTADRFAESAQLADQICRMISILLIALQSMLLCISIFIFDTNTTP